MTDTTAQLADAYRTTAIAWDLMKHDSTKANPLFKQLHAIYKQLRHDRSGREAITALMADENVGVRISAASDSLGWAPEEATKVLEEIERNGPGLYRTTAKYTLKSFREGTLDDDW